MKSHVVKLYDTDTWIPPEELTRWRIGEEEIDARLSLLARNRASWMDAPTVELRDSVACSGASAAGRWNQPLLLFYPGFGMAPGGLEQALVGLHVGDSRTVETEEGPVTLTVTRILRRADHPINDALVRLEAIDGVETLADYRRWYREVTETQNRRSRSYRMGNALAEAIGEGSQCFIDPEEEDHWVWHKANACYDTMVARGIDPTVPSEGTDFLTEEQARQKYYDMFFSLFKKLVINTAICKELFGLDYEEALQRGATAAAESQGKEPVEFPSTGRTQEQEEHAITFLTRRLMAGLCEKYLEV